MFKSSNLENLSNCIRFLLSINFTETLFESALLTLMSLLVLMICMAQIVTRAPIQVITAVFYIQVLEEYPIEGVSKFAIVDAIDNWI